MIEITNIEKIYNPKKKNKFTALKDISLSIEDGEMVAIVGQSGAGKTTLLHIIAGIDCDYKGNCIVDGVNLGSLSNRELADYRNKKIGIVMQDFMLIEEYKVIDNVCLPYSFSSPKVRNCKAQALDNLTKVGLKDFASKKVKELSGGQKQRVAIARAMANNPKILLADEPTGALDSSTTEEIMNILKELNEKGITIVIITHNSNVADQCDRIITLSDGKVIS